MGKELIAALDEVERSKGVSKEVLIDALKKALERSYEKNYPDHSNVEIELDEDKGDFKVYALKEVVETVTDPQSQVALEAVKGTRSKVELGDILRVEEKPKDFDRVAAQAAKNIIMQKIRDAERQSVYDQFIDREHELITGTVQRADLGNAMINLGTAEGVVPHKELIPGERLRAGDRVKLYVLEVRNNQKGAQILLSRAHADLVVRLFEEEVPELAEGLVEIYSIAREAGSRSKIAVFANEPDIDPIGACVGYKGSRVNAVVDELHGEKMDIVIYDPDPKVFITNALSPARVNRVIPKEADKSALVVVPDDELSLAIGKEGQNVRLAARLTGWKIDIKGQSDFDEMDYVDEEEQEAEAETSASSLYSLAGLEEVRARNQEAVDQDAGTQEEAAAGEAETGTEGQDAADDAAIDEAGEAAPGAEGPNADKTDNMTQDGQEMSDMTPDMTQEREGNPEEQEGGEGQEA